MARLAIRAASDSKKAQKVTTAQARVLIVVERDGRDYATLGVYRNDDGGVHITVHGGREPIIEKDATGTGYVLKI